MMRTRDFLLFGIAVVFLFTGINVTLLLDSWKAGNQTASAIEFNPTYEVSGAEAVVKSYDYEGNVARLREKLARGEGDVPGGPVFTSVDDLTNSSTSAVTDQMVLPVSIWIGHTTGGTPLMSGDLWRYVGFGENDQVGVALNDYPIYGVRSDNLALDKCGGIDQGFGYRYYIQPGKEIADGCFVR